MLERVPVPFKVSRHQERTQPGNCAASRGVCAKGTEWELLQVATVLCRPCAGVSIDTHNCSFAVLLPRRATIQSGDNRPGKFLYVGQLSEPVS